MPTGRIRRRRQRLEARHTGRRVGRQVRALAVSVGSHDVVHHDDEHSQDEEPEPLQHPAVGGRGGGQPDGGRDRHEASTTP